MADSDISKELYELLQAAEPHIEVGSALVGLLTEYVKQINQKVPLSDLLMEVGKFIKSEIVPPMEAAEKELFRQRVETAKGWGSVYKQLLMSTDGVGGSEPALEITLQLMRNSHESMKNTTVNIERTLQSLNKK